MSAITAEPVSPFRPDILKGKVVLITGGATGIGFGMCRCFGLHGAKVAITARRENVINDSVEKLKSEGIDAFGIPGDVRDFDKCEKSVKAVVEKFGRLDFLINNAAGNFMVSAEELTPNGLSTVLGIDLQGCFNMCKASLPYLKQVGLKDGSACIINITATLQYKATPFQFHAASAKAGIDVLTNTLAVEWAQYGIRCIGIAPGPISGTVGGPGGRVFGSAGAAGVNSEEPSPEFVRRTTPAGRYGRVDDIGLTGVFLCSSASGFITGTTVVVDGGQWHGTSGAFQAAQKLITKKSEQEKSSKKQNSKL